MPHLFSLLIAFGQPIPSASRPVEPASIQIEFSTETVEGDRDRPSGEVVTSLQPVRMGSLVPVRAHFRVELIASAENI